MNYDHCCICGILTKDMFHVFFLWVVGCHYKPFNNVFGSDLEEKMRGIWTNSDRENSQSKSLNEAT